MCLMSGVEERMVLLHFIMVSRTLIIWRNAIILYASESERLFVLLASSKREC